MNLDITRAFYYPTKDPRWVNKILIGTLLLFIPIVNFITIGYYIQCVRNVARGEDEMLPEWTDMGGLFKKGGLFMLIYLAYIIPFLVFIGACGAAIVMAAHGLKGQQVEGFPVAVMIPTILIWAGTLIFCLLFTIALPAIIYRYAIYESFSAAFNFSEIVTFIRSNLSNYIIMLLLDYLAFTIASFGVILCFVGVFFTSVYSYLFCTHLLGQLAAVHEEAKGLSGISSPQCI